MRSSVPVPGCSRGVTLPWRLSRVHWPAGQGLLALLVPQHCGLACRLYATTLSPIGVCMSSPPPPRERQQAPAAEGLPPDKPGRPPPRPKKGRGLALTALLCGIFGTCLGLLPVVGIMASPIVVVGLVFGVVAMWGRAEECARQSRGHCRHIALRAGTDPGELLDCRYPQLLQGPRRLKKVHHGPGHRA